MITAVEQQQIYYETSCTTGELKYIITHIANKPSKHWGDDQRKVPSSSLSTPLYLYFDRIYIEHALSNRLPPFTTFHFVLDYARLRESLANLLLSL